MAKGLLRLAWVIPVCLLSLGISADAQNNMLYPGPIAPGNNGSSSGCVAPKWTWSDGACWWVSSTVPPQFRLPMDNDNASILIVSPFTLDQNTAKLGTLDIGSANADLSGMFLQPGSTLTAASESVSDFITYSQSGGTNNPGSFTVIGTYNLQLGTLSATSEGIGQVNFGLLGNSAGVLTQSDGQNTVSGTLSLGSQSFFNNGLYNLNGGQLSAGNELVGIGATGTFEQSAGKNAVSGTLTLGNLLAGDGVYELKGTGTLTAGNEIVGNAGTGVFDQVLGSQTFNSVVLGTLTIGAQKNGNGTYILDSAGNDVVAANEAVGDAGTGRFIQGSGGSDNKILGALTLGKSVGGIGTYNMSGGTLEAQTEIIGAAGSGTFNQNNGINTVTGDLGIGSAGPVSGTYNLSGGTLKAGTETLGNGPVLGTINQTGGTNQVGILTVTSASNYSLSGGNLFATNIVNNGKLDLFGTGSLQTASITVGSSGVMTVSGTSVSLNVAQSTMNNGLIIENGIGKGTKINWGDFTGNARITIDPATNVFTNLTMLANGLIQAVAGSQFDVSGNFVNDSTQSAQWDTGGALLDFTGGGAHTFDLAGHDGAGFSNNFAWGTLVIDSGNTLNLGTGSGDAQYVDLLQGLDISGNTIINIDGAAGLFLYYNSADNPSLNGDYLLTGGGELIAVNGASQTPEPSTLLLFGSGLASLLARRKWRANRVRPQQDSREV